MVNFKSSNLFILIAVLAVGFFAYRHYHSLTPIPSQSAPFQTTEPPAESPLAPQPTNSLPPPPPSQKQTPSTAAPLATKKDTYKELLKDPSRGLDRLNLIEQMKGEESPGQISMMAYYEVLNSGPVQGASADENHQRRNVVSVAYGMYLDQCVDFKACYQYAVTAMARYPDQEMLDDLLLQTYEKYHEPWQQKQLQAEMKKYGLKPNNKKLK